MHKITTTYFLFFLCLPVFLCAQNITRKPIKGKLLPSSEDLILENIHIYNSQSGKGTLSNQTGDFSMKVNIQDTIVITSLQIETTKIVIEKMHLNDGLITINIEPAMEYLTEVRLSNLKLKGDLTLDAKNIALAPIVTSADLGFPAPTTEISKGMQMLSSLSSSPLEALYAVLSGEMSKIKRRIDIEVADAKRQKVLHKVPTSFYSNQLRIPEKNIIHFIEFCEAKQNLDILVDLDSILFVEYMLELAVEYKELYPERME